MKCDECRGSRGNWVPCWKFQGADSYDPNMNSMRKEIERLTNENRGLNAKLAHLEQKIAHGCIDSHCPECDGTKQEGGK